MIGKKKSSVFVIVFFRSLEVQVTKNHTAELLLLLSHTLLTRHFIYHLQLHQVERRVISLSLSLTHTHRHAQFVTLHMKKKKERKIEFRRTISVCFVNSLAAMGKKHLFEAAERGDAAKVESIIRGKKALPASITSRCKKRKTVLHYGVLSPPCCKQL